MSWSSNLTVDKVLFNLGLLKILQLNESFKSLLFEIEVSYTRKSSHSLEVDGLAFKFVLQINKTSLPTFNSILSSSSKSKISLFLLPVIWYNPSINFCGHGYPLVSPVLLSNLDLEYGITNLLLLNPNLLILRSFPSSFIFKTT